MLGDTPDQAENSAEVFVAPTTPVPATENDVPGNQPPSAEETGQQEVFAQTAAIPTGALMATPMAIPYHPGVDSPDDQVKQAIMCAVAGTVCLLLGIIWVFALLGAGIAYLLGIVLAGQGRSTLISYGHPSERATVALWANWIGIICIPLVAVLSVVLLGLLLAGII